MSVFMGAAWKELLLKKLHYELTCKGLCKHNGLLMKATTKIIFYQKVESGVSCFRNDTGFCKNRSKAAAFGAGYSCQAGLLDDVIILEEHSVCFCRSPFTIL